MNSGGDSLSQHLRLAGWLADIMGISPKSSIYIYIYIYLSENLSPRFVGAPRPGVEHNEVVGISCSTNVSRISGTSPRLWPAGLINLPARSGANIADSSDDASFPKTRGGRTETSQAGIGRVPQLSPIKKRASQAYTDKLPCSTPERQLAAVRKRCSPADETGCHNSDQPEELCPPRTDLLGFTSIGPWPRPWELPRLRPSPHLGCHRARLHTTCCTL